MNYTKNIDGHNISITTDDSIEALKNDYLQLIHMYNPRYVTIQRVQAGRGEALHLKVTVNAPSHYLTSEDDIAPKACNSMTVDVVCNPGYPMEPITAYYAKDHYLASPNVFRSSHACIDTWIPFTSSLITVVEKLIRDMIHDPVVTRYDSMANPRMESWHKHGVSSGVFPTIKMKNLYAVESTPVPPRRTTNAGRTPPLPGRRH